MDARNANCAPLSTHLRDLRRAHGYTQGQLAIRLGLTRQAISKWENGQSAPDLDNLRQLAGLYGCSVDTLLGTPAADPAYASRAEVTPSEGARIVRDQRMVAKRVLLQGGLLGIGIAVVNLLRNEYAGDSTPPLLLFHLALATLICAKLFGYNQEYYGRRGTRIVLALDCGLAAFASIIPLALGASAPVLFACALLGLACVFCSNRIFAWRLLYQRDWNPREDLSDPWGRKSHRAAPREPDA